jgi:hypothetical protein
MLPNIETKGAVMVRFSVAVVVALVLLATTVVSADETRKPPTAAEIQTMMQQTDQLMNGLQKKMADLRERKTRLQGALNYALMAEKYDAVAGTCEQGAECGQAQAEVETSTDPNDGDAN